MPFNLIAIRWLNPVPLAKATATVGFDCMLRQCRLRGKVDTNGLISTYIEERFAPGINFLLSAEVDHAQVSS